MVLFGHPRLGKVRLRMKNRSLYAVLTRFGIVAAVLTALLVIAPAAAQEEADMGNCTDANTCTYDENGMDPVATYTSADPEGAGVIWSTGGPDGSLFSAEGGVLAFKSSPNYEDPKDSARVDDADTDDVDETEAATDNVYVVKVRATEVTPDDQEEPAKYSEIEVKVTVENVDEAGEASILVRQPQVGVSLTATASDPDTRNADDSENANGISGGTGIAWQWSVPKVSRPVTGNDDHWVAAAGTSNTAAYEPVAGDVGSILRAQATYTDGTGDERTLNVLTEFAVRAAPDSNDAPNAFDSTDTDRSVDENSPMGTLVGAPVTTTDSNSGDVLYYTIPTTGDAEPFAIDKVTGQITVTGDVDHEDGGSDSDGEYTVTVTAIDPSGTTSTTVDIDIEAKDVNEKPTVVEADNAVKSTPEINSTPADPTNYDYDTTDNALENLTYTKDDVDDGDETEFSLAGDDAALFDMTVSTTDADELTLSFKSPPNYDAPGDADKDNTYKVSVVATDKAGLTGMADVEIVVTDVAEDGTVTVSPDQPAIGRPVTATLNEPDTEVSGLKWQWQSSGTGADGTWSDIEDAESDTYTPTAGSPAVEDDPATPGVDESVAAVPSDEGMFLRAVATYTDKPSPLDDTTDDEEDQVSQTAMGDSTHAVRAAPEVNNPPAFESASIDREVAENTTSGGNVGAAVMATDPDGDSLTYEITGGADMDKFGNTGAQITVGSAEFNYDDPSAQQTFEVELTATDPFGMSGSTMVTITVTDFNEAPDFTAEDPDDYAENGEGAVATFTATDPEGTDIIWSVSGTDGSKFSIDGGVLMFKDSPNYEMPGDAEHTADAAIEGDTADAETNNTYVLNVRAAETAPEDSEDPAKYTEHQIRVTVTNEDEAGEIDIVARQPQVGVDLAATVSDPDTRNADGSDNASGTSGTPALAWQWSVPKVSRPVTDNNDHWVAAGNTTNTGATYQPVAGDVGSILRAQATYTDGTGDEKEVNILTEFAVRAAPEGTNNDPEFDGTADYTRTIAENTESGTLLGAPVTATDGNSDVLYYTIPATTDANEFAIDKKTGQITVDGPIHFEDVGGNSGPYTIAVTATDPSGGTGTQSVTVTVTDVNEKPTVTGDATGTILEIDSTPEDGYTYTAFTATYAKADPDAGDSAATATTFSVAGDDGDVFTITSEGVLTFKENPNFDAPADADKDNTYKIMVVATDDDDLAGSLDVEIMVTDVSEDGTVKLSTDDPVIGRMVTATLDEPDTDVSGLKWQWQSSQTGVESDTPADDSFVDIEGATGDTYMPRAAVPDDETTEDIDESMDSDEGLFLRAVATYIDAAAPLNTDTADDLEDQVEQTARGKSAHAVRAQPDMNGEPAFESATIMREVEENTPSGGDVGDKVEATDPDGDTMTYEITGGADMDKFGNTGAQITVGSAELDYEEGQRTFEVELTATDPFGLSGSTMVTITVTNVNEDPTTIGLRPPVNVAPAFADDAATEISVMENTAGSIGDAYTASDPGDEVTYSVSGSMDVSVDDAGQLSTTGLDYEAAASVMVTITATDSEGATDTIDVTIMVGNGQAGCDSVHTDYGNGLGNDCEALLDSKDSLDSDGSALNWTDHAHTPMSDWTGVTMSGDPMRVTGINLMGEGLNGEIPAALGRLSALTHLNLRSNENLGGAIPAALGDLGYLTYLNLHSNSHTGGIPDLSGASMLEELYLPNNADYDTDGTKVAGTGLTGGIPEWLNGMTSLTELWLWGNSLTGGIPDLSGMTSLDKLKLANNDLDGEINAMYLPPSVTWLIIDRNGFTGAVPNVSGLSSLKLLWLHTNELSGDLPDGASFPASLDDLNVRDNMLSGSIPDLSALDNLTRLRLHGNDFSGAVPGSLGDLDSLRQLWLMDNDLTSIEDGLGDLDDTLIEIGLMGNPWADDACVPAELADVATNDYGPDNIEVCSDNGGNGNGGS